MNIEEHAIDLQNIDMKFGSLQVLFGVDFTLKKGEFKGLVGKNGAGKSTLLKIVQGIHSPSAGTIRIFDEVIPPSMSVKQRSKSVGMVYQDFSLIPDMSVVQNLFLNEEPKIFCVINEKNCVKQTYELFEKYGININPLEKVKNLNTSDMQMVEICKQIIREKKILLLDEPTAALEAEQAKKLYEIMHQLKKEGISAVFITHHIKEIVENCDSVGVLRDGKLVMDKNINDISLNDIIISMLGENTAEYLHRYKYTKISRDVPILEFKNVISKTLKTPLSFKLFKGEILGIAGLKGSGRTELFHILFGIDPIIGGEMLLNGKPIKFYNTNSAVSAGIFLVPENRQLQGLSLDHSIYHNVTIPWLNKIKKVKIFIDDKKGKTTVSSLLSQLNVKYDKLDDKVHNLSGGNQQKVVIGKSLGSSPQILLMDDPTYGVDVQAKTQIMRIINEFKSNGGSVILVSSEIEEIAHNSDRIIIMHRHKIVNELYNEENDNLSEETLTAAIQ